jgi:hypothetical protein
MLASRGEVNPIGEDRRGPSNGRDDIVIDTSSVATDTIDYVVTDSPGLTSTSTRTATIEAAPAPPIVPTDDASTAATTTAQ